MEPMCADSRLWKVSQKATLSRVPAEDKSIFECVCGNLMEPNYAQCSMCSKRGQVKAIRVTKDSKHLLKTKKAVKEAEWFHATINPYWIDECQRDNALVHVGEYRTALDIFGTLSSSVPFAMMNTIRFQPDATLSSHICPDVETEWPKTMQELNSEIKEQAVRYVNCYEEPGSVSVLSAARNIFVVEARLASYERTRDMPIQDAIRIMTTKMNNKKKIWGDSTKIHYKREIKAMENLVEYLKKNPEAYETRLLL